MIPERSTNDGLRQMCTLIFSPARLTSFLGQNLDDRTRRRAVTYWAMLEHAVIRPDEVATQTAAIEYLFEDKQVVRRLTDRQVWRWDEQAKTCGGCPQVFPSSELQHVVSRFNKDPPGIAARQLPPGW